jgi:hypothetical protein
MQLSPLHFQLSMPTLKFEDKKDDIQNCLFTYKSRLFPSVIRKKRSDYHNFELFLHPTIIP